MESLIKKFTKNDFEFGKPMELLSFIGGLAEEEMKNEILNYRNLKFVAKQNVKGETRYVLYFVYSKKRGRAYVITFRDRIRIITVFPLGRTTLKRYKRRKFKNNKKLMII